MRRHGVLGHSEEFGDVAGRKPIRLMFDQQPEDAQSRGLGESGECKDGLL